jgi:amino acid adenylation domain-containing protein
VLHSQQHAGEVGAQGILHLVLRHADARPTSLAVKDDTGSLTYAELSERVAGCASALAASGVSPADKVALLVPNSAAFVVVALACLWVGVPFVPLSTEDPPVRVRRILGNCGARVVVVASRTKEEAGLVPPETPVQVVDVEELFHPLGPVPPVSEDPNRDAYLVYTSGTTGEPKGVQISESAFRSSVVGIADAIPLNEATRALCVSSFHFDGSYGVLFPTLVAGGSVVIPDLAEPLFLGRFFSSIVEEKITHTGFSPSYLRHILSSPDLPKLAGSELTTLGLGGEECVAGDVARLWEVLPGVKVFNRYGPTETTIEVTTYEVTSNDVASGRIPIGVPHAGVNFHIINEDGPFLEAPEDIGELYIGGDQLMRGYWGDDELTARVLRFDVSAGEVLYKTGDLVWQDARGLYFYAGRSDDVVKRHGVRISLGEVADALRGVPGVSAALCLLTDQDGRPAVTAYVEAREKLSTKFLLEALGTRLPATMLPDEIFVMRSLPLTSSGKIDRGRLFTGGALPEEPPF